MPQLTSQKTEKIYLPSTENLPKEEQAWVEVRSRISVNDMASLNITGGTVSATMADFLPVVASLIKDWNFTDSDGTTIEITNQSVGDLEPNDFNKILEVVFKAKSVTAEDQKKSSPSSPPEGMATPQE
jgi:hypothetical protein